MNSNFKKICHEADLCVVGGGLAGMAAAVSAARRGLKVVLMHDRPVFGGNASSEIRMWVCGAHGENNRETGIIEEIALENLYRNPYRRYPVWDSILFEIVKKEKNITALLNCSCNDIEMDGRKIKKIFGWQTTTQLWHEVEASYFADCSGDSVLAPLSDAEFRVGREARDEFGESIAPMTADKKTMGLSCLIQAVKTDKKHTFIAPQWARRFTKEELKYRFPDMKNPEENFWYMELGGEADSIHDTEEIRDELIKVAYGIWDFVKNSGECDADNWELDFVGFLPGKRESRRYVGDHIMTQNDVRSGGKFDDIIAYGGWTMDDHDPAGINTPNAPNIFHPAPSPFGIPYRCIYSKNISNLFFAGRNISVTHAAMSATRVMATCAILGQAAGTAAYVAKKYDTSPRGVYEKHIEELQRALTEDGCYLPGIKTEVSEITKKSKIVSEKENAELLINGHERKTGNEDNCFLAAPGDTVSFLFGEEKQIGGIRMVFDSDLDRKTTGAEDYIPQKMTVCNYSFDMPPVNVPKTLVKDMDIYFLDKDMKRTKSIQIRDNHQRMIRLETDERAYGAEFEVVSTTGNDAAGIYSIDIR